MPSKILAAAILKCFPEAQLKRDWVDAPLFCYEVIFPFPFQPNFLILIQEKIRAILKGDIEPRYFEMMPSNAAELFKSKGQKFKVQTCLAIDDSLVKLVEIAGFTDISIGERHENAVHLDLLDFIQKENSVYIVGGFAPFDKELKALKKRYKEYVKETPIEFGLASLLFAQLEDQVVWLEKGRFMQEGLINLWKKVLKEAGFMTLYSYAEKSVSEVAESHKAFREQEKVAELCITPFEDKEDFLNCLLEPRCDLRDVNHIFYLKEKEGEISRSCLQLLQKIPKMLFLKSHGVLRLPAKRELPKETLEGLEYRTERIEGKQISFEVMALDGIGREWKIASCTFIEKGIRFSLIPSVSRLICLILDQTKGKLPFELCPTQVVGLVLERSSFSDQVKLLFEKAGIRVVWEGKVDGVASFLKKGWKERVPYAMIVGKKEEALESVALIELETRATRTLKVDEAIEFLQRRDQIEN